jgi:HECT-domain (ubiquitin-transferase)
MVRIIFKHILGWPITFEDIKDQDDEYFQSLRELTKIEDVSNLFLDFTITEEKNGTKIIKELVKEGSSKEVTNENLAEFLKAILRYRTFIRTLPQLTELLLGFFDVVPEPALTIFDANELELILCGFPVIDLDDWKENTDYKGIFEFVGIEHDVVQWFWEVVEDFDLEMKARLLQFATGTSGVPVAGFAGLQGNDGIVRKFTILGVDSAHFSYPKSHTCFNRIDLPTYSSREELAEKLTVAIATSFVGFDVE